MTWVWNAVCRGRKDRGQQANLATGSGEPNAAQQPEVGSHARANSAAGSPDDPWSDRCWPRIDGKRWPVAVSASIPQCPRQTLDRGEFLSAITDLRSVVRDQPELPIVLCSLGDGMSQQGEVLEAIAHAAREQLPVLLRDLPGYVAQSNINSPDQVVVSSCTILNTTRQVYSAERRAWRRRTRR